MKSEERDVFFLKNIFPSDFQAVEDINLDLILRNGIQTCGQIKFMCLACYAA